MRLWSRRRAGRRGGVVLVAALVAALGTASASADLPPTLGGQAFNENVSGNWTASCDTAGTSTLTIDQQGNDGGSLGNGADPWHLLATVTVGPQSGTPPMQQPTGPVTIDSWSFHVAGSVASADVTVGQPTSSSGTCWVFQNVNFSSHAIVDLSQLVTDFGADDTNVSGFMHVLNFAVPYSAQITPTSGTPFVETGTASLTCLDESFQLNTVGQGRASCSISFAPVPRQPPVVGTPMLSVNPKSVSQTSVLTATVTDDVSTVQNGEYFVGADPGVGNGLPMSLSGGTLSATIGTSLAPGVYTVGVRARDVVGNWSPASTTLLVVYDPNGGYATGGGWIVPGSAGSDAGDLLPGLDGSSKANLGFVVKYQSGASTTPSGHLEFHYDAGKFHLTSTNYEWLVVTNKNQAQFQGDATVNGGSAVYPFKATARDGDPTGQTDRFTIKIYAPGSDPSTSSPVYQASGDLSGGQIIIHSG